MICIGKTYKLKDGVTKRMIESQTGFIRNKDIAHLREGVVVMAASEMKNSKWGLAFYCIPRTVLFPTPAPELGENRYKEELIIFESEFMSLFEMMYIEKDVKESVAAALDFLSKLNISKLTTADIHCANCGRSVYVGKCCDNPKTVVTHPEESV